MSEQARGGIVVRAAELKDLVQVQKLYALLFADQAQLDEKRLQPAEQSSSFLIDMIGGKAADILLLEHHGKLIGFALVQQRKTADYACLIPHEYALLMDLYVDAERQNNGYGTILMQAAMLWARERKLDYLELNVLEKNLSAMRFYERLGLQSRVRTMCIDL